MMSRRSEMMIQGDGERERKIGEADVVGELPHLRLVQELGHAIVSVAAICAI